jgi:hypothetical protein
MEISIETVRIALKLGISLGQRYPILVCELEDVFVDSPQNQISRFFKILEEEIRENVSGYELKRSEYRKAIRVVSDGVSIHFQMAILSDNIERQIRLRFGQPILNQEDENGE